MPIINYYPSANFNERIAEGTGPVKIDILVIHYTGMLPENIALDWLCNPESKVSAHYLIDEKGSIFNLVPVLMRAWHAGKSYWRGATDINSRSIGIELVNPGHDFGYRDFSLNQVNSLIYLANKLLSQHPIPPRNVLGHSDISPSRKIDPGERFPWKKLAEEGIGLWPNQKKSNNTEMSNKNFIKILNSYGYDTDNNSLSDLVTAFQRHFRPELCDGIVDKETQVQLENLMFSIAE